MAEILVLVEHLDGNVKKVTTELLTKARQLGEPSAVFVGAGFDTAKERLAEYGAAKVYVADGDDVSSYLVGPSAGYMRKRLPQPMARMGTDTPVRPSVRWGMAVAASRRPGETASAAAPAASPLVSRNSRREIFVRLGMSCAPFDVVVAVVVVRLLLLFAYFGFTPAAVRYSAISFA